jgi:hypothetical protein
VATEPIDYCREIEAYLCRKNDGHLIRVVGPSFELVSRWAADGVPLKIAFQGIDRHFDRYYAKGPRRRPVRIDFCEADVRDVFDEWRRAVGLVAKSTESTGSTGSKESTVSQGRQPDARSRPSLARHLERGVARLSQARASGVLPDGFDPLIDRAARELDAARGEPHGLRGEARRTLAERLDRLDAELVEAARAMLDAQASIDIGREADTELSPFRATMTGEAWTRARAAAIDRLVREHFGLPVLALP